MFKPYILKEDTENHLMTFIFMTLNDFSSNDFILMFSKHHCFATDMNAIVFSKWCSGQTYCKVKPGGRGLKFGFINC